MRTFEQHRRSWPRRSAWLAAASVLALSLTTAITPTATATPARTAGTTMTWSLVRDFQAAASQANPAPDRYGNPDVWSYLQSRGTTHTPRTYTLLATFQGDEDGVPGLDSWVGPSCLSSNICVPQVGVHTTGTNQSLYGGTLIWPAGAMLIHPSPTTMAVVAWTSPVTGTVTMTAHVHLIQKPNCGNGVQWSIDNGKHILVETNLTPRHPRDSTTLTRQVQAGQTFYLTVNPYQQNYLCDSTITHWTITTGA